MNRDFEIALRIRPPTPTSRFPLEVRRPIAPEGGGGLAAAFDELEEIPDNAEAIAEGFIGSEALARKLEYLRERNQKIKASREQVRRIIKENLAYNIAEHLADEYLEDLVDELFDAVDGQQAPYA